MTKFRATLATFTCATALALSAATTAAATFSELQGYTTEIKVIEDLPAPPKATPGPPDSKTLVTAPNRAPQGSSPQTSTFKFRTTPLWGVRYGR